MRERRGDDDMEVLVCFANNFVPIRMARSEAYKAVKQIHDSWANGNKGLTFSDGDDMCSFISLRDVCGAYVRPVVNTHERQIEALEKIAKAASDGDDWRGNA